MGWLVVIFMTKFFSEAVHIYDKEANATATRIKFTSWCCKCSFAPLLSLGTRVRAQVPTGLYMRTADAVVLVVCVLQSVRMELSYICNHHMGKNWWVWWKSLRSFIYLRLCSESRVYWRDAYTRYPINGWSPGVGGLIQVRHCWAGIVWGNDDNWLASIFIIMDLSVNMITDRWHDTDMQTLAASFNGQFTCSYVMLLSSINSRTLMHVLDVCDGHRRLKIAEAGQLTEWVTRSRMPVTPLKCPHAITWASRHDGRMETCHEWSLLKQICCYTSTSSRVRSRERIASSAGVSVSLVQECVSLNPCQRKDFEGPVVCVDVLFLPRKKK